MKRIFPQSKPEGCKNKVTSEKSPKRNWSLSGHKSSVLLSGWVVACRYAKKPPDYSANLRQSWRTWRKLCARLIKSLIRLDLPVDVTSKFEFVIFFLCSRELSSQSKKKISENPTTFKSNPRLCGEFANEWEIKTRRNLLKVHETWARIDVDELWEVRRLVLVELSPSHRRQKVIEIINLEIILFFFYFNFVLLIGLSMVIVPVWKSTRTTCVEDWNN